MRTGRLIAPVVVALAVVAGAQPARACFFCEEGAYNTAIFVTGIFGLFFLGMLMLCIAYWKAGAFRTDQKTEMRVLEAEGVTEAVHE
jgi:hypothetical protein